MKAIIYIFLLMFVFCSLELNAQNLLQIDTVSFRYFNGLTKQEQIIDSYKIINNTDEEYLTWVSLLSVNSKSNVELIRNFFMKRKGDFNYLELMYENLLNEKSINIIGYSFIKNITQRETFSYFIVKTNSDSKFYIDRIVVIPKKEVEKHLKISLNEKYFFPQKELIILETPMDSLIFNSQKIDIENIKRLSDMYSAKYDIFSPIYDDCDSYSVGITPELRHCLRIQLQREDSLLKKKINDIIADTIDTLSIKKLKLTQEIWEQYRYAYCNECTMNPIEKTDVFSFLKCAIELTIKRREDIEKLCEY